MKDLSTTQIEIALQLAGKIESEYLHSLPTTFKKPYSEYINDMKKYFRTAFWENNYEKILNFLDIDFVTVHYITRHPTSPGYTQIVQASSSSAGGELKKYESNLQVYPSKLSPYIRYFSELSAFEGEPRLVFFESQDSQSDDENMIERWLCVKSPVAMKMAEFTKGSVTQEILAPKQVAELRDLDPENVEGIVNTIIRWSKEKELPPNVALDYFRDACRVTFLILHFLGIGCLPRSVILAPVFVQGNFIGGCAFLGKEPISRIGVLVLSMFVRSLLTQIRLSEEQILVQDIYKIEELNALRSDIINGLMHSTKEPLQAISNGLDGVIKTIFDSMTTLKDRLNLLQTLSSNLHRIQENSNMVMDTFGREDMADLLNIQPVKIQVKNFVENQIILQKALYDRAGIELNCTDISEVCFIQADKKGLQEIFDVLLGNAVRYARKRVSIIVKETDPKFVYFQVRDDGPGVLSSIRHNLFQAGVRSSEEASSGHGFGLYYSRLIARRHEGGDIYYNNEFKQGAEFIIKMPRDFIVTRS